jgi:hypothetical protein
MRGRTPLRTARIRARLQRAKQIYSLPGRFKSGHLLTAARRTNLDAALQMLGIPNLPTRQTIIWPPFTNWWAIPRSASPNENLIAFERPGSGGDNFPREDLIACLYLGGEPKHSQGPSLVLPDRLIELLEWRDSAC